MKLFEIVFGVAVRQRLLRELQKILLGKLYGAIPHNLVHSLAVEKQRRANELELEMISPAATVEFGSEPPPFPLAENSFVLPARYLVRLPGAIVFPISGTVLLFDSRIALESVGSLYKLLTYAGFAHEARKTVTLDHDQAEVIVLPVKNYYHFILESLPGLIRARTQAPKAKIFMEANPPRYAREILALMGITDGDCIEEKQPARVSAAWFQTRVPGSQFISPQDIVLLRETLIPSGYRAEGNLKLFISRKQAPERWMNEAPYEVWLASHGFEIFVAEEHDVQTQLATMCKAQTIVGFHGAGLTNIIFARPGCRVIELFRPDYIEDCYARLLRSSGHDYTGITIDMGWTTREIESFLLRLKLTS